MKIILLIYSFVEVYYTLDSALYVAEKQTRRTATSNGESHTNDVVVEPIKSRSPVECILKCRIQSKESFYVARTRDEQNCYCLRSKEDQQRELSSSSQSKADDGANSTIDGLYMNKHEDHLQESDSMIVRFFI